MTQQERIDELLEALVEAHNTLELVSITRSQVRKLRAATWPAIESARLRLMNLRNKYGGNFTTAALWRDLNLNKEN